MNFLADLIAKLFAALLAFWSGERQRRESNQAHEELGASKAVAAGHRTVAKRVEKARIEEAKAEASHVQSDDDSAFDKDFRRG